MNKQDLIEKLKSIQLIKENDARLRLGVFGQPPKVECRVIAEDLFQEIIQVLTERMEASSNEIKLAESIIKKHYPFYNPDVKQKDIEINGERAIELMLDYATQSLTEPAEVSKVSIKRYTCTPSGLIIEQSNGELVKYEDYLNATQSNAEAMRVRLKSFEEWLQENRWFTYESGKWSYSFEQGTSISKESYDKKYRKTTQELYTEYLTTLKQ